VLGVFVILALAVACSGSSPPGPPPTPASEGQEPGSPPAAAVDPAATQTPDPLEELRQIEPIPPPAPLTTVDALLGGAPDRHAAAAIRESLAAEGFDLSGVDFFVLPQPSGAGNMLIAEIDYMTGDEGFAEDQAWLERLIEGDTIESFEIERVVLSWRLLDESNEPVVLFIFTIPVDALRAVRAEEITSEEALQQARLEMREVQAE